MQKITKAIIPVAGWGTRRLPITKVIEKSMLPVGNRPLVDYSVQELIEAGVTDIYIVLNDYLISRGKADRVALTKTLPEHVKIHYIAQDANSKYGTAVPVAMAAEEYNLNEPVIVYMGDDFIWNPEGESAATSLINSLQSETDSAILGVEIPKEKVDKYGVLEVQDGKLTNVVEKPSVEEAPSNLINVSKYILSADLLQKIVAYVNEHDFGPTDQEYMITDPIYDYIEQGQTMRVASTSGQYLDGGSVEGWVHANNVVCGVKEA